MNWYQTGNLNPIRTPDEVRYLSLVAQDTDHPVAAKKAQVILSMNAESKDGSITFTERIIRTKADCQVSKNYIITCLGSFNAEVRNGTTPIYGKEVPKEEPKEAPKEEPKKVPNEEADNKEVESPDTTCEQVEGEAQQESKSIPINPEANTENAYHKAFRYVTDTQKEQGVKIVSDLLDAQTNGFNDELQMGELSERVRALDTQIGPSILFGLISLPINLRSLGSSAIETLGRYMEGWSKTPNAGFHLSQLTIAVMICYLMAFLKEDVRRFAFGMLMSFLPEEEWNTAEVCRYLGCGKNLLPRGFSEYCSSGFNWGGGRTRQPGAGGPSIQDTMSEAFGAVTAGVMIIMQMMNSEAKDAKESAPHDPVDEKGEDLTPQDVTANTAPTDKEGTADEKGEGSTHQEVTTNVTPTDGEGAAEDTEKDEEKAETSDPEYTFESLSEATKGLGGLVQEALSRLEGASSVSDTKRAEIFYLEQMQGLLTASLSFLQESLSKNQPFSDKGKTEQEENQDHPKQEDGQGEEAKENGQDNPEQKDGQDNPKQKDGQDNPEQKDGQDDPGQKDGQDNPKQEDDHGKGAEIVFDIRRELIKSYKLDLAGSALENMAKQTKDICTHILRIFTPTDSDDVKRDQIKAAMAQIPKGACLKQFMRNKIACMNARKSALNLASATLSALKAQTINDLEKPTDFANGLKNIDLGGVYTNTLESLRLFIAGLEKYQDKNCVKSVLLFLHKMETTLSEEINEEQLVSEDANLRASLFIFLIYVSSKVTDWGKRLKSGITPAMLRQICGEVSYKRVHDAYELWLGNYRDAIYLLANTRAPMMEPASEGEEQNIPGEENSQSPPVQNSNANKYSLPSVEKSREQWNDKKEKIKGFIEELMTTLRVGAAAKREKEYSKKDYISDALDYLDGLKKSVEDLEEEALQTNDALVLVKLLNLACNLLVLIEGKRSKLEERKKQNKNARLTYTAANMEAGSILKRFKKDVEEKCAAFKKNASESSHGYDEYQAQCADFHISEDDMVHKMFYSDGHLTALELCEEVSLLLKKGDNPMDPMAWIDHIIEKAGRRDLYGDAADDKKFCNIVRKTIQHAFHYFTGLTFSENALFDILTGPMGFSRKQCPKLEQHGVPHECKYQQLDNIDSFLKHVDLSKVLVISCDTKAMVKLGKMRTPGGVFMCAPGVVVPVCDHDFPFKLYEIYENTMCELFTEEEWESWKNEYAVLHPVCAYCLNDNSAYMGLVLGKDTAESMCNTILRAFLDKKESMPNLERVALLCDGGGANQSMGIIWTGQLKKLADKMRLPIDVLHYPPGNSKYNTVEHAIFGPLSRYWKNFPLLTIENVGTHILEMAECFPHISKMTVWLDKRHYAKRAELLKAKDEVCFRTKNDDRIISPYADGDPMQKLNYTVLPTMGEDEKAA